MNAGLALDRRNLAALGAVTVLLAFGYVLVPHPVVKYGVWLVVFSIWMAWFVLTAVAWLSDAAL